MSFEIFLDEKGTCIVERMGKWQQSGGAVGKILKADHC